MKYSMYFFIIAAILVVVYGAYEYTRVSKLLNESKKLVAQSMQYTNEKNVLGSMLVLGDSTAVGVGAQSTESVPARFSEALGVSVENHAESGARMKDVASQFEKVNGSQYDIVLIHAGANDAIYGTGNAEIKENIAIVLEKAKSLGQHVVFLTSGDIGEAPLWPFGVSQYMTHRTKIVRRLIKSEVENHGALYVDLYALPTPFKEDPQLYYAADFLHLSGEGYRVWADLILQAIRVRWPEKYGETQR